MISVALCECGEIYLTDSSYISYISPYRQFLSDVITETMEELQEEGTFTNLLKALGKERESKMHFYDIIAR